MKKIIKLILVVVAFLLFTACDKSAEVKQFMVNFSTAVASNDKATIEKMYPDAAKAESLSLTFDAEKDQVEEVEGKWKITLSDGKDIILEKNKTDDSYMVKESHGLFVYSAEQMDFAKKTGWIKEGMSDMEIANQFCDTMFVNYLAPQVMSVLKPRLKIFSCSPEGMNLHQGTCSYRITVLNDNDFDIPADAYELIVQEKAWDPDRERDVVVGKKAIEGIALTAKGKDSYLLPDKYDYEYSSINATIRIKYSDAQAVAKFLKPTGKEYQDYLASKKQ